MHDAVARPGKGVGGSFNAEKRGRLKREGGKGGGGGGEGGTGIFRKVTSETKEVKWKRVERAVLKCVFHLCTCYALSSAEPHTSIAYLPTSSPSPSLPLSFLLSRGGGGGVRYSSRMNERRKERPNANDR